MSRKLLYNDACHTVQFHIIGNDENERNSCVVVSNKETTKNEIPIEYGLSDLRMGTTMFNQNCTTCSQNKQNCPGHFGTIMLNYPVKSPLYRDDLFKILKIICYYCGNIVMPIQKRYKPNVIVSELAKIVKKITNCHACGKEHMHVIKDKKRPHIFMRIVYDTKIKSKIIKQLEYFNHEIEEVVNKISDETVQKLGIPLCSSPKNMVLRVINVPPNCVRPNTARPGGNRTSSSAITVILRKIIELNNLIVDVSQIPREKITDNMKNMFFDLDLNYFSMIKQGGGGEVKIVSSTNKPPESITERLPKKEGRFRKNLLGKRVEYMIRSVITGDARLRPNELAIPIQHARNIEIPETVTALNINRLNEYYLNGTARYPGCRRIIKKSDGNTYNTNITGSIYALQIGDVVLRDMINGDVVAFNRQPSLLPNSIVGMSVVITDDGIDTLRFNPMICKYFNADFDGDNMNSIVPCLLQSRVECMTVGRLSRWLISPQKTSPLSGAFQDAAVGLAELTKSGIVLDKWHAMAMLANVNTSYMDLSFLTNAEHSASNAHSAVSNLKFSSRELISCLLPNITITGRRPTFYNKNYSSMVAYNKEDIEVNIICGKLISGVLDKAVAGEGAAGGIFHIIANEYGNDRSFETIYNLQQLTDTYLMYHGFTSGIADVSISDKAVQEIRNKVAILLREADVITQKLDEGKLIAPLGMSIREYYEAEQINALSAGDDFVYPILNDINFDTNMTARMIMYGSKGKILNFVSINANVGNQLINGKRFSYMAGWGRTSPYFTRYSTDPRSRGYVAQSFREGISSSVWNFCSAEVRFGQVQSAISTAVTGDQNRTNIKNLESCLVDNLRKVVKNSNIVQFLYADCGIDPTKTEKVTFPTIMISDAEFEKKYKSSNANTASNASATQEFALLSADRELYRKIFMKMESENPRDYILDNTKHVPVNIPRVIDNVLYTYKDLANGDILDIKYLVDSVAKLCDTLPYAYMNEIQEKANSPIPYHYKTACTLMFIQIRSYLCYNNLTKIGITNKLLDIVIAKIKYTFKRSLVEYGLSAGIMAAQCASEVLTQYNLNSRHRTGGVGGTKTDAILKCKEVLGARPTENMQDPSMIVNVKPEYSDNKVKVKEIADHIEMMHFGKFVSRISIFYESYGKPVHPDFKHEEDYINNKSNRSAYKRPTDLAKWCIRFEINKEELILKSMQLETIVLALYKSFPELYMCYTPENAKVTYIRCYMRSSKFKACNTYIETNIRPLIDDMEKTIVRGIDGIVRADVFEIIKTLKQSDGSLATKKIFSIYCYGSNLEEILAHPDIDPYNTTSNSVLEVEKMFGVIAARNKIVNELIGTLEGTTKFHCVLFGDEMTFSGCVTSIQKTGLQKREMANILLRAAYQMPVQVLHEAAVSGYADKISGVSGPLIMGAVPQIGTNYNKVILNEKFVAEHTKSIEDELNDL